jgi:hypothetical protein
MEVKLNNKMKILRSFIGWIPVLFISIAFYGLFFFLLLKALLLNIIELEESFSYTASLVLSSTLVVVVTIIAFRKLIDVVSSYQLSVVGGIIFIKGRNGKDKLDEELALESIKGIAFDTDSLEKLKPKFGILKDLAASRITFYRNKNDSVCLDFGTKAFQKDSLRDFLIFVKEYGVQNNVGV